MIKTMFICEDLEQTICSQKLSKYIKDKDKARSDYIEFKSKYFEKVKAAISCYRNDKKTSTETWGRLAGLLVEIKTYKQCSYDLFNTLKNAYSYVRDCKKELNIIFDADSLLTGLDKVVFVVDDIISVSFRNSIAVVDCIYKESGSVAVISIEDCDFIEDVSAAFDKLSFSTYIKNQPEGVSFNDFICDISNTIKSIESRFLEKSGE